jgi:hypothetical protein
VRRSRVWLGTLLLAVGCGMHNGTETRPGADPDLVASMDIRVAGDTVQFGLHVTNTSADPVVAEFTSGQRYDFVVRTAAGEVVWRWSDEMGFTQALGTETVESGGWLQYRESWAAGGRSGRYIAEARLVSSNRPIELRMEFELPAR